MLDVACAAMEQLRAFVDPGTGRIPDECLTPDDSRAMRRSMLEATIIDAVRAEYEAAYARYSGPTA